MHLPLATDLPDLRGLRVAFINAPIRESVRPGNAPLGPALLAARLEQAGADVTIVDLNAYRPVPDDAQTRTLIEAAGDRQLYCLSGLITTLARQEQIARIVRDIAPKAMLVSGGGLATTFRAHLFDWIPELDAVCHSEGDDVILEIGADALSKHREPRKVYDGRRPKDLDALPFPAWHLLDPDVLEGYVQAPIWGEAAHNSSSAPLTMARSINTVSSRGCPFACSFCDRTANGERNYRMRSAENLWREMRGAIDTLGVDFIGVTDDNAMVDPRRIRDMPALGNIVRWGTHGRLDEAADMRDGKLADRLRVNDMAAAGCVYIGFGAESACPKTLEAMGKGGHMLANGTERINGYDLPRTMLQGIRNTVDAGIHPNCTWIRSWPGETLDDLKHSIAFMLWQKTQHSHVNVSAFVTTAYPPTELFKHPRVREVLARAFGLAFRDDGSVVVNEALRDYTRQLGDATKMLIGNDGRPVNFGEVDDETFWRIGELVDAGRTEEVLGL